MLSYFDLIIFRRSGKFGPNPELMTFNFENSKNPSKFGKLKKVLTRGKEVVDGICLRKP